MRIIIEKDDTYFGKKKPYIASFGKFQEKGENQSEAKEKLIAALEWYFSEEYQYSITTKQIPSVGLTLFLERHFYGYSISKSAQSETNKTHRGVCSYGRIKHSEALEKLQDYVENYLTQ